MTRTEIINAFIQARGYKSYLELGVNDRNLNFKHIQAAYKFCVDEAPSAKADFVGKTVDFFANCDRDFDVIFIDADHTEAAVLMDFLNAKNALAKGGVIVFHDAYPPDDYHQRDVRLFKPGQPWCGQVWKAVLTIFATAKNHVAITKPDYGVAVYDTALPRDKKLPNPKKLTGQLDYGMDFAKLDAYVVDQHTFAV